MFEEDERFKKTIENNLDNPTIIQKNNDAEKNKKNNDDNIFNENNINDIKRISNSFGIISILTDKVRNEGTCFFMCIMNKKYLITNGYIIPTKKIKEKEIIELTNNIGEKYYITLDKEERQIINIKEPYNIKAIEILEKDNINNYLTLDQQIKNSLNLGKDDSSINTNYISNIYGKESIYILNYINNNSSEEIFVSFGLLNNIDRREIQHK